MDQSITSTVEKLHLDGEMKDLSEIATGPGATAILEQHRMYTSHQSPFDFYGKWLWFSNGDLELHAKTWEKLQPLAKMDGGPYLESSRTGEDAEGVIKCYAKENKEEDILKAGLAFQEALEADYLLFFKTNEATKEDCFVRNACSSITKYMLTPTGKLYRRDDLKRWQRVKRKSVAGLPSKVTNKDELHDNPCPSKHRNASEPQAAAGLPSNVADKDLLHYNPCPQKRRNASEPQGSWSLRCNFKACDSNGLTEVDRVWLKAVDLCSEGIFSGVACGTKVYAKKNEFTACLMKVYCHGRDVEDIDRAKEIGCKFLDNTFFCHPITFKISSNELGKSKKGFDYLLTEEKEFYIIRTDRRIYLKP